MFFNAQAASVTLRRALLLNNNRQFFAVSEKNCRAGGNERGSNLLISQGLCRGTIPAILAKKRDPPWQTINRSEPFHEIL
jgi:hypothetical protein